MKLIRTITRNVIADVDITRMAKAMINIYHGRCYFLDDGSVDLDADDTYLEWEQNGITYHSIPVRGFIHVNFAGGVTDSAFKSVVVRAKLLVEFKRLNQWGWRKEIYTNHKEGSSQFTLEKYDASLYKEGSDIAIVVGEPFHSKNSEHKFCWIINSDPRIFQYSTPGKFPKNYAVTASLATVIVDVAHSCDLPDNFHSVGFPELRKPIVVVPGVIYLSRVLGIDAHIYHRLGGPVTVKSSRPFTPVIVGIAASEFAERGAKVHRVKTITDLAASVTADSDGTECTACRVALFDRYYQIERSGNVTHLCRFCAHYDFAVSLALNSGQYRVAIADSATTRESAIESIEAGELERDVLRRLNRAIARGSLEFGCLADGELAVLINGAILSNDEKYTLIGMQSGAAHHSVLERVHKFSDFSMIFEYDVCS